MAKWFFEPGHTAAMFRARHMMVTYVRGHFKNVSGSLVFGPENPAQFSADVAIDAAAIWTGQSQRDAHLRSADFLDVENHSRITFKGTPEIGNEKMPWLLITSTWRRRPASNARLIPPARPNSPHPLRHDLGSRHSIRT